MANAVTQRFACPEGANTLIVPALDRPATEKRLIIRNAGDYDLRVTLCTDSSNYWTIKPLESMPAISGLASNREIDLESVGGSTIVEAIIWEN